MDELKKLRMENGSFEIKFLKDITKILWDKNFKGFINSLVINRSPSNPMFLGESFVLEDKKCVLWRVKAKIDRYDVIFVFRIPLKEDFTDIHLDLNSGLCNISSAITNIDTIYSVVGYYDKEENILLINKVSIKPDKSKISSMVDSYWREKISLFV